MRKPTAPIPEATELLKLENQLCFPLYAASRMFTKAYQPLLQELDLTYPQYLVLLLLWEHGERTVKQLGEELLLDSGTLTPLLKRMEQRQWLTRCRDPRDERSVVIGLTESGQQLRERACAVPAALLEKINMSATEFNQLRAQLKHLLTLLA